MRKYLFLFIVSLLQLNVFGQSTVIHGTVINSNTKEHIGGVIISTDIQYALAVTNDEGKFSVYLEHPDDLLSFSHISFMTTKSKIINDLVVELLPLNEELEEIMVFKKPIEEVFAKAFVNMSSSVKKGDLYETYVREFNIINNKINVADALVDFYISKPGGQAFVEVKERRTFESKKGDDKKDMEQYFSVMGTGDFRKTLNIFVDVDFLNKMIKSPNIYDYVVRKQRRREGQSVVILDFKLKDKSLISIKDLSEKNGLAEGYIVFDESLNQMLEYRLDMAQESKENIKEWNFLGLVKIKFRDFSQHALLRDNGEGMELSYGMKNTVIDLTPKNESTVSINIKREVKVDKLTRGIEMPRQKSFKDTSLYGSPSNYQSSYWLGRNIRPLTVKESTIFKMLNDRDK